MANTLTGLTPTLYAALSKVSREMVGLIRAVSRDSTVERAAKNDPVRSPVARPASAADTTPGVTAPNTGDGTVDYVDMTITKSRHVPIRWNGEEQRSLLNAGTYGTLLEDQFAQAMRTLVNEIEADLAALYTKASRAHGVTNATPFATAGDLSDVAGVLTILDDNGAPMSDRQLVLGSGAMGNIRGKQSSLFKVNEAGSDELLRNGTIGRLEGFNVFNSAQIARHTPGTADADYDVDLLAGYAVGDTTIHLDTGTGTHVAGDLFIAAGDANKYIITTGAAGSSDKDIVIGAPGLRQTLADGVSIGAPAAYRANMAFHRTALQLATRVPAMPIGPNGQPMDMADDIMTIVDPLSGLAFEVAVYRQFMQLVYHVRLAWGVACPNPQFLALLIGQTA